MPLSGSQAYQGPRTAFTASALRTTAAVLTSGAPAPFERAVINADGDAVPGRHAGHAQQLAGDEAVVQADVGRTPLAVSPIIMVAKAISADAIVILVQIIP
jgi:hypothetical protein